MGECKVDQIMRDRTKGINKVEPGAVKSFFVCSGMEKKGVQNSAVLNAAVNAREKGFLEKGQLVCQTVRKIGNKKP